MTKFLIVFKNEIYRLKQYKIIQISFLLSIIWMIILYFIKDQAKDIVPLFIFSDAALMSMIFVGVNLFYERQENTSKTLLVLPINRKIQIYSKVSSAIFLSLQSTVLLGLFSYFFLDVNINFFFLVLSTILITILHSLIGYIFSIISKDFNGLLVLTISFMFLLAIPSILLMLNVFDGNIILNNLLLMTPTENAFILLNYSFYKDIEVFKIIISLVYNVGLSFILFKYYILKKYFEKVVEE